MIGYLSVYIYIMTVHAIGRVPSCHSLYYPIFPMREAGLLFTLD